MRTDALAFLKTLNGLQKQEKVKVKIYPSPYWTETVIEVTEERSSFNFGWSAKLEAAIFEYHENKCIVCGLSDEESLEKYDRHLEMHHTTPLSFSDSMVEYKFVTEMFVPLCRKHHPRGPQ